MWRSTNRGRRGYNRDPPLVCYSHAGSTPAAASNFERQTMGKSKIEWTDKTWNPVTGCTPISPGCKNCYAEKMARRLKAMGQKKYRDGFAVRTHIDCLDEPLRWGKPCLVFVCSMGDLFHDDVPTDFILTVFFTISVVAPHHTYLILTKRAERMEAFFTRRRPPENIYVGVSVEDQKTANERVPHLLRIPDVKRFVSAEPLIDAVHLNHIACDSKVEYAPTGRFCHINALTGRMYKYNSKHTSVIDMFPALDGVIVGCESGKEQRPMKDDWARNVRDECKDAGVPFFLKQMKVDGKLVKMPHLDGVQHKELP